jgi:hypothetical protein
MARRQSRRTISLNRAIFEHAHAWATKYNVPLSSLAEHAIEKLLADATTTAVTIAGVSVQRRGAALLAAGSTRAAEAYLSEHGGTRGRVKISSVTPNVANAIAAHVWAAWPEIATITKVWFTGSQIWNWLYTGAPPAGSDWDIFALDEEAVGAVADCLGLRNFPSCRTQDKRASAPRIVAEHNVPRLQEASSADRARHGRGYNEGFSYTTARGELDLWLAESGGVITELRSYPTASHAHCRAAFSFEHGLVVLQNENAAGGALPPTEAPLDTTDSKES